MTQYKHILLIGAGGTGAYLVPTLAIVSDNLTIVDGDTYESSNMARQPNTVEGAAKVDVLQDKWRHLGGVAVINKFIDGTESFGNIDLIVLCVDNNEARSAGCDLADEHECPMIVCGNETWDPMAFLYEPDFKYTQVDPFVRHQLADLPDVVVSCEDADNPLAEQTAPANYVSGAMALIIMESMKRNPDNKRLWLAEAMSSPNPKFKTVKKILNPEPATTV